MTIFTAAAGLSNPHLQTLVPRFIRKQALFAPQWQTLETPDGDFLDLAWSESPEGDTPSNEARSNKPIFVLFHGLEGSFESPYANGLMNAFAKDGWLSVMMHFRGCSGKPNRLARAYHSGEVEDARFFLKHLDRQFPNNPKVAVGISLGGNMLANYLVEYADDPLLSAATIVSAPFDLACCSSRIERGFSKIYKKYLLNSLKSNALKKGNLLQDQLGITAKAIKKINKLYEFDERITAPLHGFKNAQDYYAQCSALPKLNQIKLQTQIIHAKDDPFMTDDVIPKFVLPDNIDYRLFQKGGHVGFITGSTLKPRFWLEEALPAYYESLQDSA
ncbi:hydrolase [Vibrio kanaloae]|uniref:Hydrolase n=1 Tax=Vibrio kanaloae TaxID=170673 RepID=A0A4U1Z195_9VIBR|nr:hydrolase [Vibrio kanaloae]TKF26171.1 hydrolase [Vibrio kanaloae]TKF79694.1 hydrolase [Vibrio kanaloae]